MRHVQLAAMFIVMAAIGPWAGSALAADPPGGLKEKEAQRGSTPILRTPNLRSIMGQEGCHGSTTEVFSRVQA
jgi:hypothetical protein